MVCIGRLPQGRSEGQSEAVSRPRSAGAVQEQVCSRNRGGGEVVLSSTRAVEGAGGGACCLVPCRHPSAYQEVVGTPLRLCHAEQGTRLFLVAHFTPEVEGEALRDGRTGNPSIQVVPHWRFPIDAGRFHSLVPLQEFSPDS